MPYLQRQFIQPPLTLGCFYCIQNHICNYLSMRWPRSITVSKRGAVYKVLMFHQFFLSATYWPCHWHKGNIAIQQPTYYGASMLHPLVLMKKVLMPKISLWLIAWCMNSSQWKMKKDISWKTQHVWVTFLLNCKALCRIGSYWKSIYFVLDKLDCR